MLGASKAEHAALQGGRGVLHWLPFPVASASDLAVLLDTLHNHQLPIDPALTELTYLCIQGRVWQLVGRGNAPMGLLLDAYAYHCSWLVEQARIQEAQLPACRALRLFGQANPMRPHWFGVLHALAKGAAELGSRPSPLEGVALLRRWLPQAERDAPESEAWFLRDIAEYLSFSRYRSDAEAARQYAQLRSQPWVPEDPNVALSNALVLLNLGQPEQALENRRWRSLPQRPNWHGIPTTASSSASTKRACGFRRWTDAGAMRKPPYGVNGSRAPCSSGATIGSRGLCVGSIPNPTIRESPCRP